MTFTSSTQNGRLERIAFFSGIILLLWFLFTFLVLPLLTTFQVAFFSSGEFRLAEITADLSASSRVKKALLNTAWMTLATTVTVGIVGIFQVAVLEYFHVKGRTFLKVAFAIPLVFGSVVAATGYKFTYGPAGVVTQLLQRYFPAIESDWFIGGHGVLYSQTFLLTSFYYLFLRAAMRRVDYSTVEAARSLGASEFTILRRVVLPVIMPTLFAVMLLTIYTSTVSFAVPEIIGGRDFVMISQIILVLNSLGRPDMAAFLALFLGLFIMSMILLMQWIEAKGSYVGGSKTPVPIKLKRVKSPLTNIVLHGIAYLLAGVYILPVFLIMAFSFAPAESIGTEVFPSSFTLSNYASVFSGGTATGPFFNSIRMGLLAIVIGLSATLFAVPIMVKYNNWLTRLLDIGFFLPWIVPSVLLAIGLIVTFDTANPLVANQVLLGTFLILPIAYTIHVLPLMVRFLRAAFMGIDPSLEEAARSMGANGIYRFRRVILPLVIPTVVLAAGYTFNEILTEYPLSAFLYNVNNRPISIAILDSDKSTNLEQAAITLVYAVLIMAFSMAVILFAERLSLGKGPKTNSL